MSALIRSAIIAVTCAASLSPYAVASPADATSPAAASGDGRDGLEEIIVTGSLLRRPVSEQSQLITTIGAEELEKSGAGNAVEALARVAQNQAINVSTTTFGGGSGFGSFANLRSLGSSNTLVLFDSKRVAVNAFETRGVDLNTIPLNMIERIETLADGASSIYGSDAVAGVINFVPRREMQGLSISAGAFMPESEGGEKWNAAISGGIGDLAADGWNVFAGLAYQDKDPLFSRQRDFSATSWRPEHGLLSNLTSPNRANWAQTGTVASVQNPYAPTCNPPVNIYAPTAAGGSVNSCFRDTNYPNSAIPEQTDQSFLINGSLRLGNHTARLQYFIAETDLLSVINENQLRNQNMNPSGPAGVNPFFPGGASYPTGGPALPGTLNPNAPVQINWRTEPFGLLIINPLTRTDRYLAQLNGNLGSWDYEVFALRSTSHVTQDAVDGFFDLARARDMLTGADPAIPYINPFGPQSAAAASYIETIKIYGRLQDAESSLDEAGVQVSRDLFTLAGGPAQLAIAADLRKEEAQFRTMANAVRSGIFATAVSIDGDRDIAAVTSEINLPLLDRLEVNLSLRHDDYSDFGSTTNPKILVSWNPLDALTLRASYNEGFRAPTLRNLHAPRAVGIALAANNNDPVLCPGGIPIAGASAGRDCNLAAPNVTGGNPNIGPETSEAFSGGIVFEPTSSLSFEVDYWRYNLFHTISTLTIGSVFGDLGTFGSLLVRCSRATPEFLAVASVDARCSTATPGIDPIAYIDIATLNLGETKTSGMDFAARWDGLQAMGGKWSLNYRGTAVLQYDYQTVTNGPFLDRKGIFRDGFPVIDYSHYLALGWENNLLSLQLSHKFLDGYVDCNAPCGIAAEFFRDVGSYQLWDLAASVRWPANTMITGRVTNLLDRDPPFTNKSSFQTGYDERFTDPIGRAFSITVRYDF